MPNKEEKAKIKADKLAQENEDKLAQENADKLQMVPILEKIKKFDPDFIPVDGASIDGLMEVLENLVESNKKSSNPIPEVKKESGKSSRRKMKPKGTNMAYVCLNEACGKAHSTVQARSNCCKKK